MGLEATLLLGHYSQKPLTPHGLSQEWVDGSFRGHMSQPYNGSDRFPDSP